MSTVQTDWRCYRRGQLPGDFVSRWASGTIIVDGALQELAHRNSLVVRAGGGAETLVSWSALDVEASANIEMLARVRVTNSGSTLGSFSVSPLVTRASGTSASPTCYRATLNFASTYNAVSVSVQKVVAGVTTTLNTSGVKSATYGSWIYVRLRVNGTTVQAKLWAYGDTEPVGWDVTATDSAIAAAGWSGVRAFYADEWFEVAYLAGSTNGETAPAESTLPAPMDVWCRNPDVEFELVAEVEHVDPSDGTVATEFVSNLGRSGTSTLDYPPSTKMEPLLDDAGGFGLGLAADLQFGGAALPDASALRPLLFRNDVVAGTTKGLLDGWNDLIFSGHAVALRAGQKWLDKAHEVRMPARHMELLYAAIAAREPDVAERVSLPIAAPTAALQTQIPVRRCVGIATGIKALSTSGSLTVATKAAYDVKSWTLMRRLKVPVAGIAGTLASGICARQAGGFSVQFQLQLWQASSSFPHQLRINIGNSGATAFLVNSVQSGIAVNTGEWTDTVFAISETSAQARWYWMVNGTVVASGTIVDNPFVASGTALAVISGSGGNLVHGDLRLYNTFIAEDEARSLIATAAAPDTRCVLMPRMDDNTGTTVTDYSAQANHGTMAGVQNTDWQWEPTYLGGPEVAGQPYPIVHGQVFHAPTLPIDSARELFRYNDGAKTAGTTLNARVKGLAIATPAAWSEPVDGVVDIVGASDQPVTVGLENDQTIADQAPSQLVRAARDCLYGRGALALKTMDYESFNAARRTLPFGGGLQYSQPPTVAQLLDELAALGLHYRLDNSGRVGLGYLPPPINPGPYGSESLLELWGQPGGGVTFANTSPFPYILLGNGTGKDYGLMLWFKITGCPIDLRIGVNGYALVSCGSLGGGTGYTVYVGTDGRVHFESYGAGATTVALRSSAGIVAINQWIGVQAWHSGGNTGLRTTVDPDPAASGLLAQAGSMGQPSGTPLIIGGRITTDTSTTPDAWQPIVGSICYVCGFSPSLVNVDTIWSNFRTTRPTSTGFTYFIPLTDGEGEDAADTKNSRIGRIHGARWCPRATLDFRSDTTMVFSGLRRAQPAWRVDAQYQRNYAPLAGADIAGGVSASTRVALGQAALDQADSDSKIRDRNALARDLTLQTNLRAGNANGLVSGSGTAVGGAYGAQYVAIDMRQRRLAVGRKLADFSGRRRDGWRLLPTDEVMVYHPRYLSDGKAMRIYSLLAALQDATVSGGLWG